MVLDLGIMILLGVMLKFLVLFLFVNFLLKIMLLILGNVVLLFCLWRKWGGIEFDIIGIVLLECV